MLSLVASTACVSGAGSVVLTQMIGGVMPAGRIADGSGTNSGEAANRLIAEGKAALATATRSAMAAAAAHPEDLRLQRRAAALVRITPVEQLDRAQIAALLERLEHTPCPGLADVAATMAALGNHGAAGETYLRDARECRNVDAAIAAVAPLREAHRCGDAVAGLRAAWPLVDVHAPGATVHVLDAVAECSDAVTLRANLAFVPPDVVADYFALLDQRHREDEQAQMRADDERREREAADRARDASFRCESECGASESSCESSCAGQIHCSERCSSVFHACKAGCG